MYKKRSMLYTTSSFHAAAGYAAAVAPAFVFFPPNHLDRCGCSGEGPGGSDEPGAVEGGETAARLPSKISCGGGQIAVYRFTASRPCVTSSGQVSAYSASNGSAHQMLTPSSLPRNSSTSAVCFCPGVYLLLGAPLGRRFTPSP
jgi:hypothetical protein